MCVVGCSTRRSASGQQVDQQDMSTYSDSEALVGIGKHVNLEHDDLVFEIIWSSVDVVGVYTNHVSSVSKHDDVAYRQMRFCEPC